MVIGGDTVKLCSGLIVVGRPVFTGIERYLSTSVIPDDHALVVVGINPQVMMVTMRCIVAFKCAATVL